MVNVGLILTVIGDKVRNTTSAREGLNGTTPDESTYSRWMHVFSASSNALETSEELAFFTIVVILFFVFLFVIIYNIFRLIKILMNLDGSLYQTSHIIRRLIFLGIMIASEVFILKYIIEVTQVIK